MDFLTQILPMLAITIVVLLVIIAFRQGNSNAYDERQIAAQGKAWKWAYITLAALVALYAISESVFEKSIFTTSSAILLSICISATVYACICIIKDAYTSFTKKKSGQIILFFAIGILNIINSILCFIDGTMFNEEGLVDVGICDLWLGIAATVFAIILLVKSRKTESDD